MDLIEIDASFENWLCTRLVSIFLCLGNMHLLDNQMMYGHLWIRRFVVQNGSK